MAQDILVAILALLPIIAAILEISYLIDTKELSAMVVSPRLQGQPILNFSATPVLPSLGPPYYLSEQGVLWALQVTYSVVMFSDHM